MAKKFELPSSLSHAHYTVLLCYQNGEPVHTSEVIDQCNDLKPDNIYSGRYSLANKGYLVKTKNGASQITEHGRFVLDNIDQVKINGPSGKRGSRAKMPPSAPAPEQEPIDIDVTADQLVTNISSVIHANSEYRAMLKKQVIAYRRQADEIEQFLNSKKTD